MRSRSSCTCFAQCKRLICEFDDTRDIEVSIGTANITVFSAGRQQLHPLADKRAHFGIVPVAIVPVAIPSFARR